MSDCKEKGYHGSLSYSQPGRKNGWICKDCGGTGMCSLCGKDKDENLETGLYDMVGEQICAECTETERPISETVKKYKDLTDRELFEKIMQLEAENERLRNNCPLSDKPHGRYFYCSTCEKDTVIGRGSTNVS